MKIETFKRKNDIGVEIEYYIIGNYNYEEKEYRIYTDFFPEDNIFNLRILVDLKTEKGYKNVNQEQAKAIINKFHHEVLEINNEVLKWKREN